MILRRAAHGERRERGACHTMPYSTQAYENLFQSLKPFLSDYGQLAADAVIQLVRAYAGVMEQVETIRPTMQALLAARQRNASPELPSVNGGTAGEQSR